jgi:hypothetical protein
MNTLKIMLALALIPLALLLYILATFGCAVASILENDE